MFLLDFLFARDLLPTPSGQHSRDWGDAAGGTAPAPLASPPVSCHCHRQPRIPPPRLSPCRSEPGRAVMAAPGGETRRLRCALPPRGAAPGARERRGCGSAGREAPGDRRDTAGGKGG